MQDSDYKLLKNIINNLNYFYYSLISINFLFSEKIE